MLDSELVEMGEPEPVHSRRLEVEVLESGPVSEQVLMGLALLECRRAELCDLARSQGFLHGRVGAEGCRPFFQEQVSLHIGCRRGPDAGCILCPHGLVIKMPGAVIGRPTPGASVLEKVDKVEGAQQVAMTEDEVLVELRPRWPLRSM